MNCLPREIQDIILEYADIHVNISSFSRIDKYWNSIIKYNEIVKEMKKYFKYNHRTIYSYLNESCEQGSLKLTQYFIDKEFITKVTINKLFYDIITSHCRLNKNNIHVLKWLVQYESEKKNFIDAKYIYKLKEGFRYCCIYGKLDLAKWIFELCSNPGYQPINTNDHFQGTIINDKLEIAMWLIETDINKLIDIHVLDELCFRTCIYNGKNETAKWIVDLGDNHGYGLVNIHINDETSFRDSLRNGYNDIAMWLLELGENPKYGRIDIHAQDEEAFHSCLINRNTDMIHHLLSLGEIYGDINLNARNGDFFEIFCEKGYYDLAETMISTYNINIHKKRYYAFRKSCKNGHLEIVKLLLKTFPNIDIHIYDEYAFRMSCSYGHLEIAKLLINIDPKIYVNVLDDRAFRLACVHGHYDVVEWLCENFLIDIYSCDNMAFKMSCLNGHLGIVKYLIHIDAKSNKKRIIPYRPFSLFIKCCRKKYYDIVKLIVEYYELHFNKIFSEKLIRWYLKNN
jgi:ankyrin repeat protein